MSADINTTIKIKGTKEELINALNAINYFATDMHEQYRKEHNCAYVNFWKIINEHDDVLSNVNESSIKEFLEEPTECLIIDLSGPYGVFCSLSDVGLFEAIADAAPNAYFTGCSDGFNTGGDLCLKAELKDGKLHLEELECLDEDIMDDLNLELFEKFKEYLPFEEFCELFYVEDEDFSEEDYDEFISEAWEEGFPDMDYDYFTDLCEVSGIDIGEYDTVIEELKERNIPDFYKVQEKMMEEYTICRTYDPITKKYN
jgi:hypothetical protein